jgi:hypothetical protein
MDGIIAELLRLEGAKKDALIKGNAPAYDEQVRAQLRLLDSAPDLESAARKSPGDLAALSSLLRLNTTLFRNLVSTSSLFLLNQIGYTSTGNMETHVGRRIAVRA